MNPVQTTKARWFAAIPLWYDEKEHPTFWGRDAALWCGGFQALGVDSKVVALGEPGQRKDRPLILCTPAQMQDAGWWKQWNLDGVVLYSWALPRYEPIARAIKEAGLKLVIILDTGGFVSPHVWLSMYFRLKRVNEKERGSAFPTLGATVKTAGAMLRLRHARRIRHLEHADVLAIPCPLAKQRYARYLAAMKRRDLSSRLHVIPHPVAKEVSYNPAIQKQPIIIAVGAWQRLQKNPVLLIRALERVLAEEPTYSARIIGSGQEKIEQLLRKLKGGVASRIHVIGPVSHEMVRDNYQSSQISLCSSYYEAFSIAMAEALCCGCSVVGNAQISSLVYCAGFASGTLSCDLSLHNFTDALLAEIEAWRSGERDPIQISRYWTARLHPEHAVRKLLSLFGRDPATDKCAVPGHD